MHRIALSLIVTLLCIPVELSAQDQTRAAKTATISAGSLTAVTDTRLPRAFQSAMESGDLRAAKRACGSPCKAPATQLAAPGGGGTRDYTCNSGNCACAGAADCVAMAPICQEDTIGCNDYGCTCKQAEGDGDG